MYQVSILVPIYGVEKYIERCARSLFEQTYENLEYIFVDDCTPDKSMEILLRVMEDYPNRKGQVRIIRHEHNRGLAAARNTALDAATSPFISHVDSDDYLSLDAIQLLVEKQLETGADIVTGNYFVIDYKGIKKILEPEYNSQHEMLLQEISYSNIHHIWRRLINIRLYNDYHIRIKEGIDFMEDWQQIGMLVYYAKNITKIKEPIYYHDCTNNSSYVSIIPHNKRLWIQAIEAASILENFYADKGPEYKKITHRTAFIILKHQMSFAARCRDKLFFEDLKRIIKSEYTDCYDAIGWNNPFIRTFMFNYTLNSIYRRSYASFQQLLAHTKQ